ncbi:MAG: alpha/beta hydrolase [Proteobacteria bacterium]|nr:alpha/beta hydrolase [Pseudomonadota bacterium]
MGKNGGACPVPEENRKLVLPDGRVLAYREYGCPDGRPVFYFHGFPASRLEASFAHGPALAHGVRVIAPDRPGYGLSDFAPDRTIGSWADDVAALADALGAGRFSAIGVSGGGPYLLACAARLSDRMDAAALVCGLGPVAGRPLPQEMIGINRVFLGLSRSAPPLCRGLFSLATARTGQCPRGFLEALIKGEPGPDREILGSDRRLAGIIVDSIYEAFRQGSRGPALDLALYGRPWDFDISEIPLFIRLWHGEADTVVPAAMGREVASLLPRRRAVFVPGEGHFSLVVRRLDEIMLAVSENIPA